MGILGNRGVGTNLNSAAAIANNIRPQATVVSYRKLPWFGYSTRSMNMRFLSDVCPKQSKQEPPPMMKRFRTWSKKKKPCNTPDYSGDLIRDGIRAGALTNINLKLTQLV